MNYPHHYHEHQTVAASAEEVFAFIDDHRQFSAHMGESSMMMAGSTMQTKTDEQHGRQIGSHIYMEGTVCGVHLFLDEVIIEYNPPYLKMWQTVGKLRLIVIGHYQMGVKIEPVNDKKVKVTVLIDYQDPATFSWLGRLFGPMYAKWCIQQMLSGVVKYFVA